MDTLTFVFRTIPRWARFCVAFVLSIIVGYIVGAFIERCYNRANWEDDMTDATAAAVEAGARELAAMEAKASKAKARPRAKRKPAAPAAPPAAPSAAVVPS